MKTISKLFALALLGSLLVSGQSLRADDAKAHRAFLSPDEPLSPDERRCVSKAL